MRVAVDVTPLAGPRTGVGHMVAALVDELERDGGVEVVRWRLPRPGRIVVRWWAHTPHPLPRAIRAADVVHGTNYVAPPTGRPTVLTVHDATPFTHPEWLRAVNRPFAAVVRRNVERGAWIHTPSHHVAGVIRDVLGTDRVEAVPLGAPRAPAAGPLPHPSITGRGPYILALGTSEPRKNLPRLIHAFTALAFDHPDLHLVIAGHRGDEQRQVDATIGMLAGWLGHRVHVLGPVPEAMKWALLRQARVYAYPSLDEGFGIPVLEAFAVGTPVVASTAGSLPEIAGDAAILADPLDTEAIGHALVRALDDEAERERLVARGRARLAAFDWSDTARRLVTLYGRAVAAGPSA